MTMLLLLIATCQLTEGDLAPFLESDTVAVGRLDLNESKTAQEARSFATANSRDFEFLEIKFGQAWLKWKSRPSKESLGKLFKAFETVAPGKSRSRKS
jgi:hypothetical protein